MRSSTVARRKSSSPASPAPETKKKEAQRKPAPVPPYLQRKLSVGAVNDVYEAEADRTAARIGSGGAGLQRKSEEGPEERKRDVVHRAIAAPEKKQEPKAAVQRKAEPKKDAPKPAVQRRAEPKKDAPKPAVQRKAEPKEEKRPAISRAPAQATPGQREPMLAGGGPAPADVENRLAAQRGGGTPLPEATRAQMEQELGHELTSVRIHSDSEANQLARDLDAQAFTVGSDVYFGAGKYDPASGGGQQLLAHELTHVVQQGGADMTPQVERKIQRNGTSGGSTGSSSTSPSTAPPGVPPTAPATGPMADLQTLRVPAIKRRHTPVYQSWAHGGRLKREKGYDRGRPDQRGKWRDEITVNEADLRTHITNLPTNATTPATIKRGSGEDQRIVSGTVPEILERFKIPPWDRHGRPTQWQVDHIVELQVAGDNPDSGPGNQLENMELLDNRSNANSGAILRSEIHAAVVRYLDATSGTVSADNYLLNNDVQFFRTAVGGAGDVAESETRYWTRDEITRAAPAAAATVVATPGHPGTPEQFALRSGLGGILLATFRHETTQTEINDIPAANQRRVAGLVTTLVHLNPGYDHAEENDEIGHVIADWDLPESFAASGNIRIPLHSASQFSGYLGTIPPLRTDFSPMSPVVFDQVTAEGPALRAEGRLTPTIPLLDRLPITVTLDGRDIEFAMTYTPEGLRLPIPGVSIDGASLAVFYSTREGLGVRGGVGFSVRNLGSGSLSASVSSEGGFGAEGTFNFDSRLFDRAEVTVRYRNHRFSGAGTLEITTPDKIKGIRSGRVEASFEEGSFRATGSVVPSIPGIAQADLAIAYAEADGLTIAGDLQLSDSVPGIQGGTLHAEVRKVDEDWRVSGRGTVTPRIPGLNTQITLAYDDGAFLIEGRAAYNRGMLSGEVQIGVTNQAVGADGVPAGEPTENLTVYGGGTVTIRICPWLQGRLGLRLLPNGEIEATGAVELPSTLTLFDEKAYTRNIFRIGIDIPIVGVSVAGQRIGIFATIGGGLDLSAGVGPGELRELGLQVTYNPAHEDQTHISGGASLYIPAHAGLRLSVHGALGVGIPIVSAEAGLEVGGELGLQGAVQASVHVDWTPTTGLSLDAVGEIFVEPKFTFDITGYVLVQADLLITTIELYSKRWRLAQFEYGSNLRLGMRLPVHYRDGQPFDVSWSDVEFVYPDLDASQILSDLIDRIA